MSETSSEELDFSELKAFGFEPHKPYILSLKARSPRERLLYLAHVSTP